jgi:hypothetical protein
MEQVMDLVSVLGTVPVSVEQLDFQKGFLLALEKDLKREQALDLLSAQMMELDWGFSLGLLSGQVKVLMLVQERASRKAQLTD